MKFPGIKPHYEKIENMEMENEISFQIITPIEELTHMTKFVANSNRFCQYFTTFLTDVYFELLILIR